MCVKLEKMELSQLTAQVSQNIEIAHCLQAHVCMVKVQSVEQNKKAKAAVTYPAWAGELG